jgi:hypothetical protein
MLDTSAGNQCTAGPGGAGGAGGAGATNKGPDASSAASLTY